MLEAVAQGVSVGFRTNSGAAGLAWRRDWQHDRRWQPYPRAMDLLLPVSDRLHEASLYPLELRPARRHSAGQHRDSDEYPVDHGDRASELRRSPAAAEPLPDRQ